MHCIILVHAIADESRHYMQHAVNDKSTDTSNTRAVKQLEIAHLQSNIGVQ